jgi:hypothetical protein
VKVAAAVLLLRADGGLPLVGPVETLANEGGYRASDPGRTAATHRGRCVRAGVVKDNFTSWLLVQFRLDLFFLSIRMDFLLKNGRRITFAYNYIHINMWETSITYHD